MSEVQTDHCANKVETVLMDKNGNVEVVVPNLRRRRTRSFSRAESIVTEEEKIRRAQPDKPWVQGQSRKKFQSKLSCYSTLKLTIR